MSKLIINSDNNLFDSNNLWKIKDWVFEEVDIENEIHNLCGIEHPKAISIVKENLNKYKHAYCKNPEECLVCIEKTYTTCEKNFKEFKIDWFALSENSCAVEILKKNIEDSKDSSKNEVCKISWKKIVFNSNPDVRSFIEENLDKVFSKGFFSDSMHVDILEKYIDKYYDLINWDYLSYNRYATSLLEKNQDKINWNNLSYNINAIHLLEQNFDKINWDNLSRNENAIHLLEKNKDKINWEKLEYNKNAVNLIEEHVKYTDYIPGPNLSMNPNALSYLKKNPQYINWEVLKFNKNYIETPEIFENNLDKFDGQGRCLLIYHIYLKVKDKIDINKKKKKFSHLYLNKDIFELDYDFMKNRSDLIKKELIQKTWHPRRLKDWCLDIEEFKVIEDLN